MAVFFNGQLLVTPVTASAVNDDAMRNQNLTVGNAIAYIGKADGGEPKTDLSFGSPDEAIRVLRGGELLTAVINAFDPSAETGAPSVVHAIRVDPAERATLVLKDDEGEDSITLRAENWGSPDNMIRVKVEDGSNSGKLVTVQRGDDYFTGDDIGRAAFTVQYDGGESTPTLSVSDTTITLSTGTNPAVEIDLEQFDTLGAVVDRINGESDWIASLSGKSGDKSLNALDAMTDQDASSEVTVRADLQAIVDWFNSQAQILVRAERATSAGSAPANVGLTYLSGGTNGSASNTDWADAFTELQSSDVQWVSPVSGDAAIHAMADSHVAFCSTVLRKERRAICGTASGTDDETALEEAAALNSDRTSLIHIGHYDYDASGNLVLLPPYMTAGIVAAAFAGSNPGTPLTNKSIKVRGLERKLRNPADTDPLITGGVMPIEDTPEGYKVVKSISTWTVNDNYNRVEVSTGVALDFTVRNVREAVDVLRGQKSNPLLLSRARSIADSTLRELARAEPAGPGVLAGDEENPAYRNITASVEGDVVRIQFECSPVIPANYVLVTVYAVPYSGSAAA